MIPRFGLGFLTPILLRGKADVRDLSSLPLLRTQVQPVAKNHQPSRPFAVQSVLRRSIPPSNPGLIVFAPRPGWSIEKRHLTSIVVRVSGVKDAQVALRELTCADYVSTGGAGAVTRHAWQSGEVAQIASWKAEISIHGKDSLLSNNLRTTVTPLD